MTYSEVRQAVFSLCGELGIAAFEEFSPQKITPTALCCLFSRRKTSPAAQGISPDASKRRVYFLSEYDLEVSGGSESFAKVATLFERLTLIDGLYNLSMGDCRLSGINKLPLTKISFCSQSTLESDFTQKSGELLLISSAFSVLLSRLESETLGRGYGLTLADGSYENGSSGRVLSPIRYYFCLDESDETAVLGSLEPLVGTIYDGFSINGTAAKKMLISSLKYERKGKCWTEYVLEGLTEV